LRGKGSLPRPGRTVAQWGLWLTEEQFDDLATVLPARTGNRPEGTRRLVGTALMPGRTASCRGS